MLKKIIDGIFAGILISIGGCVFLACDNRYAGAVLFSVALLCICLKGYSLYTGKICYIADSPSKDTFAVLLLGLLGNAAATAACGYGISFAMPAVKDTAYRVCSAKLDQPFASTLIRGIFCGILIYLAVDIFRRNDRVVGILFCIPVFILCGFEHSIADMYYFAASGIVSLRAFGFIWTVILGNSAGGLLIPVLSKIGAKEK